MNFTMLFSHDNDSISGHYNTIIATYLYLQSMTLQIPVINRANFSYQDFGLQQCSGHTHTYIYIYVYIFSFTAAPKKKYFKFP